MLSINRGGAFSTGQEGNPQSIRDNNRYPDEILIYWWQEGSRTSVIFQIQRFMGMILPAPFSLWFPRCGLDTRSPATTKMEKSVKGESIKALSNVHQNGFLILGCVRYNIMPVKARFWKRSGWACQSPSLKECSVTGRIFIWGCGCLPPVCMWAVRWATSAWDY